MAWITKLTNGATNPIIFANCKPFAFSFYFSIHYSPTLLLIMSLEKFFALYFPLKSISICTVRNAKWVTGITAVIFVAFESQHFFLIEAVNVIQYEWVGAPEGYTRIYDRIDSFLYSLGPFTIKGAANVAIIYKFLLEKSQARHGGTESANQALSKATLKGTAMLITVSIIFLLLTGSMSVTFLVTRHIHPIRYAVLIILKYLNHAINGVLYCISGSRFRDELLRTFPFSLRTKRQELKRSSSTLANLSIMSNSSNPAAK